MITKISTKFLRKAAKDIKFGAGTSHEALQQQFEEQRALLALLDATEKKGIRSITLMLED